MTMALTFAGAIVLVYAAILGLLWRFQERIVFQPPLDPGAADAATETIAYTSADGIRLHAHVVEPDSAGGPLILAFHGNAVTSRWMLPWATEVSRRLQATVVIPEYRGYDGLAGVPTYEGAAADALAGLTAVRERYGRSPGEMIYYGHSLGTAMATELASAHPPRALLLEAPFTSARDMAGRWRLVGLDFFWRVISRVHYDTRARVATLDVPVHVVHGERDIVVPAWMGPAVHSAARRRGQLLMIAEAGHNDVPLAGGDAYWRWLAEAARAGQR